MAARPGAGRREWRQAWRRLPAAAAALACLALGGCIYLRLLELKNQLASFDRYFDVDLRDGVKITCKEPVLLDEDMAFFRLAPESRQRVGVAERWHFRWIKAYAAPGENPADYEVAADFIYVNHKLTRVILPERLFVFVPKKLFLAMIREFGHARIDRARRTASANVHVNYGPGDGPPRLDRAGLRQMLGAPMEQQTSAAGELWRYRYRGASTDQQSGYIDVTFTIEPATQTVRHLEGVVFNGRFNFDFNEPPPHPPAATPMGA